MRYLGKIYRPPSEADSYILQATIGCSWNKCTYCDMYREKEFSVRPLAETLEDARVVHVDEAVEQGDGVALPTCTLRRRCVRDQRDRRCPEDAEQQAELRRNGAGHGLHGARLVVRYGW